MQKGRIVKWLGIVALLTLNIVVWTNTGRRFISAGYDDNTGQFSAPPLTFSLQSFDGLPDHMRGEGRGKTRLLSHDYIEAFGTNYIPRAQGNSASCVGQSAAAAVDILGAVEFDQLTYAPPPRSSASWIYGMSREVGGIENRGRGSYARLAVRSLEEVGFLYEDFYFMQGYDLTGNDPERDKQFRTGTPPELFPLIQHRITGYYKLHSYADVRDAIYAGMPVVIGSSVGFGRTGDVIFRDDDGFLSQPRFRFRGRYWAHAMCLIGVCDNNRRGVLCLNSWGSYWVDGPQRFGDEPLGSFWIDDEVVEKMVFHGDAFCIYGLQ